MTDKGHLPLPMGEVPEAERAIFTLSVGFAASSPRVGAKGEREERIVTEGNPQGEHQRLPLLTKGSLCPHLSRQSRDRWGQNALRF